MENLNLILFVCITTPLCMMLFILKDHARNILMFLLFGIFFCLFAGEINAFLLNNTALEKYFIAVNISPVVEEFLKAIPIAVFFYLKKPSRQSLLEYAVAVGIGFATLENVCITKKQLSVNFGFALARGFGSGMMHGICTLAVGYSLSFVDSKNDLAKTGTVAAISVAIIYHSIYNIIVQSQYSICGILLPLISFIPLIITIKKQKQKRY